MTIERFGKVTRTVGPCQGAIANTLGVNPRLHKVLESVENWKHTLSVLNATPCNQFGVCTPWQGYSHPQPFEGLATRSVVFVSARQLFLGLVEARVHVDPPAGVSPIE